MKQLALALALTVAPFVGAHAAPCAIIDIRGTIALVSEVDTYNLDGAAFQYRSRLNGLEPGGSVRSGSLVNETFEITDRPMFGDLALTPAPVASSAVSVEAAPSPLLADRLHVTPRALVPFLVAPRIEIGLSPSVFGGFVPQFDELSSAPIDVSSVLWAWGTLDDDRYVLSVQSFDVTPVSLPESLGMLAAALVALGVVRRRV